MKTLVLVKPAIGASVLNLYKELEAGDRNGKRTRKKEAAINDVGSNELNKYEKTLKHISVQQASFQRATKWLIILGQIVGLMPVVGICREPPEPIRFKVMSLKIIYGLVIFVSQTLIALVNVWIIFETTVSVTSVGHLSFYVSSAVTTILFFQVAKKWPSLLKKIPDFELDEHVDPRIKTKCNMFIVMFLAVAIVEHMLAQCSGVAVLLDCSADYSRLYRDYIELSFPWVAEFGLPDHFLIGISIQFINTTATLSWNYSDLFIVCISYYLTSIIHSIYRKVTDNKAKVHKSTIIYLYNVYLGLKSDDGASPGWSTQVCSFHLSIFSHSLKVAKPAKAMGFGLTNVMTDGKLCRNGKSGVLLCRRPRLILGHKASEYMSSSFWASVREDFNHATQLVRAVDEVVSGTVFTSFTINLFFICFQLYNLLSDGMRRKTTAVKCPRSGSGPFGGYENVIYLTYSMMFVLFRYLCVSLIAARVHTTAQSLASALYNVPSTAYNVEVQRFLDQVHHDTVALSGFKFFYVTKSLVLTVAGTIFTYELVLLQYGGGG